MNCFCRNSIFLPKDIVSAKILNFDCLFQTKINGINQSTFGRKSVFLPKLPISAEYFCFCRSTEIGKSRNTETETKIPNRNTEKPNRNIIRLSTKLPIYRRMGNNNGLHTLRRTHFTSPESFVILWALLVGHLDSEWFWRLTVYPV